VSVDVYLGLRAAAGRHAVRRALHRHVRLVHPPFVVVGYHLPGDPGEPIGLRFGTRPDRWHTVVVGEPRDARLRFQSLVDFALDLNAYLARFMTRTPTPSRQGKGKHLCPRAPQLVVPNEATAQWLCDLMGRRLRYLPVEGDRAVHPGIPIAGAHLSFFAGERVPGSSLVLAATDVLAEHWQTGQLGALDANLAAQLAWIRRPDTLDAAEQEPPAGPIPDPQWEHRQFTDAIKAYHRLSEVAARREDAVEPMRRAVDDVLAPAWDATWEALNLLGELPEAGHVPRRWDNDLRQWTRHAERIQAGQAHFRRRPRQLQVFRQLHRLERLTSDLNRQMALDDPLVMARHVAAGDALSGTVAAVTIITRHAGRPGARRVTRPRVRITPDLPFTRPIGTELWWAADTAIRAEVSDVEADGTVELEIVRGAIRPGDQRRLPTVGAKVVFAPFGPPEYRPDTIPDVLPWTHIDPNEGPP